MHSRIPLDSRRYHRPRQPPLERQWQQQQSSANLMFPMGSQTFGRQWGQLQQQGARPMTMGFGFGPTEGRGSRQYEQFQNQLRTAQGPMADYIRQGQGFLPQMMPGLQRVGADVAGQSQAAFQNMLQGIQQGQGLLGQGTQGLQSAMAGVQGLPGQAAALTPYQQQITQQAFSPEAQQGLNLARQGATQAFNPLQNQTLYQQALQQAQGAAQQGAAARGLLGGGAGQAADEAIARQLATQFAGQQQAGQQAALATLGEQQAGLAGLQQQALQGAQGLLGTQAGLYGQQGEMANALAAFAPQAAQLSAMGLNAMPLYQQALAARYALPMAGMQDLQGFFTGAMQPGYGLLQAAMPQAGTSGSGWGIL
jgi:hypothetical protein